MTKWKMIIRKYAAKVTNRFPSNSKQAPKDVTLSLTYSHVSLASSLFLHWHIKVYIYGFNSELVGNLKM